jgi:hypothetical protein
MGASGLIVREFRPDRIGNDFVTVVQIEEVAGHAGLIQEADLEVSGSPGVKFQVLIARPDFEFPIASSCTPGLTCEAFPLHRTTLCADNSLHGR